MGKPRGYMARLAAAAGCQTSYLSQVLAGNAHLTPDHAAGLCQFWNLTESEAELFISMVHYARSGSPKYQKMLKKKIRDLERKLETISAKIPLPEVFGSKLQELYYRNWHLAGIHVLLSLPGPITNEYIAHRLRIPESLVDEYLTELKAMGIVRYAAGKWGLIINNIHLESDSPFVTTNHVNWRTLAAQRVLDKNESSLHYSSVFALSKAARAEIKDLLLNFLSTSREIIIESPEEDVVVCNIDFFSL